MTFSLNIKILHSLHLSEFISAIQYCICLKYKKNTLGNIQDKHTIMNHTRLYSVCFSYKNTKFIHTLACLCEKTFLLYFYEVLGYKLFVY